MKVGDYVRTKDYHNIRSRIGKIIRQDGKYYYLDIDEGTQMVWEKDTILTSSPNIIDLIEEGDIVNYGLLGGGMVIFKKDGEITTNTILFSNLKEKDIKKVITKEQIENLEYEVE